MAGMKISGRVGIDTGYWVDRPRNEGASLSIGTVDRFGIYVESEGGDLIPKGVDQVSIFAGAIQPRRSDRNVAVLAIAANNPEGNIGTLASVQYAPNAPLQKVTPFYGKEVDSSDVVQATVIVNPDGIFTYSGVQPKGELVLGLNGASLVAVRSTGLRIGNLEFCDNGDGRVKICNIKDQTEAIFDLKFASPVPVAPVPLAPVEVIPNA
jgi:hypothetical protein